MSALAGGRNPADPRLVAAARDFEAVYLTEMIRPMFDTLEVDPMFGGGKGEEVFRGLLADEYGKIMARSGGIGLASHVQEALIAAQAQANRGAINVKQE
jgi:Rod binding domain-containing protein